MNIGRLKHRVVLQKKTVTEDVLKQQTESWADFAYVWAGIEPLTGREYFSARQDNAEVSTRVTIPVPQRCNAPICASYSEAGYLRRFRL